MNCPNCHHPIEMGWQRLRQRRKAAGVCAECGGDPGINPRSGRPFHRCKKHRRIMAMKANVRRHPNLAQ